MKQNKLPMNKEYAQKIKHIKLIMTWDNVSKQIGTPVSTLKTWANETSPIPMIKAEDISRVYNANSGIIMPLIRKLESKSNG